MKKNDLIVIYLTYCIFFYSRICKKTTYGVLAIACIFTALIVVIVLATKRGAVIVKTVLPNQYKAKIFANGAVASDHTICSTIGTNILREGGNAVDAAVATTFCTGVANPFSCGIGGGGFMVYFDKNSSKFHVYDYREAAPSAANETMYLNKSSTIGMKLYRLHIS